MKRVQTVSNRWIRRNLNWVAHATAKWAEFEQNKIWYCNFPTPIFTHIQKDMSAITNQ
jgi:hypothetical protein